MEIPVYVYHYTSYAGLLGIIQNKRLDFHGSRYDMMNDPNDYTFAKDIAIPKLKACLRDSEIPEEELEDWGFYPYIVSFSEVEDDPFMWQHYKSNVCLKLEAQAIKEWADGQKFCAFGQCRYFAEDDIEENIADVFNGIQKTDLLMLNAYYATSFIKRKAFSRENEWRLVSANTDVISLRYNPDNPGNPECDSHEGADTSNGFDLRGDKIFAYKSFKLESNILKGIIVNELDFSEFQKEREYIALLLSSKGFDIKRSDIRITNNYPF